MEQSVDVSWPQNNYTPDAAESGVIVAATSGDGGANLFTQSTFVEDILNARNAGKPVGFYHFNGPQDATASADYFWAVIKPYYRRGDVLGLDIESGTGFGAQSPAWAAAFMNRLAANIGLIPHQLRLLIYGNRSTMGGAGWGALEAAGCLLWLAAPGGYPENTAVGEWSHWTLLQYSTAGGVDRDESQLTFAQIAGGAAPAAPVWKEHDMLYIYSANRGGGVVGPTGFYPCSGEEATVALGTYGSPVGAPAGTFSDRQWDVARQTAVNIGDQFAAAVAGKLANLDASAIAKAVVAALPTGPTAAAPDTNAIAAAVEAAVSAQLAGLPAAVVKAEGAALSKS